MPQCSAVDLVYHLFDVYVGWAECAGFSCCFFVLLCANKRVHMFAVVQARNLPGMSTNDLSSPFVSVELCPVTMFPGTTWHRTPARTSTVNPVYEEKFEL